MEPRLLRGSYGRQIKVSGRLLSAYAGQHNVTVNLYELETLVRFSVTFTNTATGFVADPGAVTLWMQDPNGNQTSYTYAAGQLVKTGIGQYYCDFAPDGSVQHCQGQCRAVDRGFARRQGDQR